MRVLTRVGAFGVLAAGIVGNAKGTVLLQDDFDSYVDQFAFTSAWPVSATGSGILQTTTPSAGFPDPGPNYIQGQTSATRNTKTFTDTAVTASSQTSFFFRFYDSNGSATAYRQSAEIDDTASPSGTGQLIAMGLNNNIASNKYMAEVLGVNMGSGIGVFGQLDNSPARSTGWHTMRAVITGLAPSATTSKIEFYVDGTLAETVASVQSRGFDNVKIGSANASTAVAGFDDVKVINDLLPVPATGATLLEASSGVGTANGDGVDVPFDWNDDTNNSWNLYVWKASDAVPATPVASDLTGSQFTALALDGSTEYSYRIDSFNEIGLTAATGTVVSFTTIAVPEPATIGLIVVGAFVTASGNRRRQT